MYNKDCPICFDNLDCKIHYPFNCGHRICLVCNDELEKRQCPLCRADIPIRITRLEYGVFITGLVLLGGGLGFIIKKFIIL